MASGTAAGGGGRLWGMLEGCISGGDAGKTRRPYHKNCKCALHRPSGAAAAGQSTSRCTHTSVSYPIRRAWSEGNLASLAAAAPATADRSIKRVRTHAALFEQIEEGGEELASSPSFHKI